MHSENLESKKKVVPKSSNFQNSKIDFKKEKKKYSISLTTISMFHCPQVQNLYELRVKLSLKMNFLTSPTLLHDGETAK